MPEPAFTLDDCSENAFRLFAQKATRSGRMDEAILRDSRTAILDNLELFEGAYLKRAACLLFSDRPERYVSGAWIKIGFFVTDDDLRYQDEIHGNLFDQVDATLEMLRTKYLKAVVSAVFGITTVCKDWKISSFPSEHSAKLLSRRRRA